MRDKEERLLMRTRDKIKTTYPASLGTREASFVLLDRISTQLRELNELLVKHVLTPKTETEVKAAVAEPVKKKKRWFQR